MKTRPHAPNQVRGVRPPPPFAVRPTPSSAEIREMISQTVEQHLSAPTGIAADPNLQGQIITTWAEMALGKYLESIRERSAAGERVMRGTNMSISAPWNWQSAHLVYPADNDESFRLKIDQAKLMNYWGVFFLHQLTRNLVFKADGEVRRLYRVPRGVADHIKTLGSDQERDKFLAELTAPPEATMTFSVKTSSGDEVRGGLLFKFEALVIDPRTKTAEFHVLAAFTEPSWERVQTLPPDDIALIVSGAIKELEEQRKTLDEAYGASLRGETAPAQPQQPPTDPPMSAPPVKYTKTIGAAFGQTRISTVAHRISGITAVRFPRSFKRVPRFADLEKKEVDDLLALHGEKAVKDGLLRPEHKRGVPGVVGYKLTNEQRTSLRARAGLAPSGFVDRDKDGREWFYRSFTHRGETVEMGWSWGGSAAPLFDKWVAEAKKRYADEKQQSLFLDQKRDEALARLATWDRSRKVMDAILAELGRQGTNPVMITEDHMKTLLWPDRAPTDEWPDNWLGDVKSVLMTLKEFTFTLNKSSADGKIEKMGVSSFLSEFVYERMGNGFFVCRISEMFVGGLMAFSTGETKLKTGVAAVLFDFSKTNTRQIKKAGGFGGEGSGQLFETSFSGKPLIRAAEGLTIYQENLDKDIDQKLTLNRNSINPRLWGDVPVKKVIRGEEARSPRVYTSAVCPLLPEGQEFHAALGDGTRVAEGGRSLFLTGNTKARRTPGLIQVLGHVLRPGPRSEVYKTTVAQALEDIRKVVVEVNFGVVAGRLGGKWVSFDEITKLSTTDLNKVRIFMFVSKDSLERREERWGMTVGRRPTRNQQEADLDAWGGDADTADETGKTLPTRLHIAMRKMDLTVPKLAALFGIDKGNLFRYFKDPTDKGARSIPKALVPVFEKWIETGVAPTPEEVAKARSRGSEKVGE